MSGKASTAVRRRVLLMISSMRGGGSERQTLLLLRHLDRTRFEPHLYLVEGVGDLLRDVPDDVAVHVDETPTDGVYVPGRIFRARTAGLGRLIDNESIDVVYDRTFQMTMLAAAATGAMPQRAPVRRVSTIVSPPDRAVPLVERRFVSIKRRRLSAAYRSSRHVVAVSDVAARSAETYYRLPPGRVTVIPNPVELDRVRSTVGVGEGSLPTLVCVGRMTVEKGQADFLAALGEVKAPVLRVVLIGDGPLRGELESMTAGMPHQFEFLGQRADPLPWVASADALVLPSRFEGMPNVVLEAMALGTPVVATRAGGTIDLEGDRPTITWAEPADPTSLAAALREFFADPNAARRRVAAATDWVNERHDATKTVRRIESLLESSLEK